MMTIIPRVLTKVQGTTKSVDPYRGPAPGCVAVTNTNGDSAVDLSGAVYLLSHLFLGGPPPVAPFPECGTSDLEADRELGCKTPPKNCP